MIPTHNSTLGLDFMRSCSIKHHLPSIVFSLEMSKSEIVMRLLSAEARIKLADMRSGRMSDDDWTRLARRMSEISEAPLYIDDYPNLTMMEIRAKARRLKQKATASGRHRLPPADDVGQEGRVASAGSVRIFTPDQTVSKGTGGPGGGDESAEPWPRATNRQEANALPTYVSRINRARCGYGHLASRPDAFEQYDPRGGEADVILASTVTGPPRTITVAHQLHLSRFTNMAKQ